MDLLARRARVDVWPGDLPPPSEELQRAARTSDGMVTLLTDLIDQPLLAAAPNLRVVANVATGYDNIDVEAATRHGVAVTNTPGVLDDTTADFAFALLMAAARRVVEADAFVRRGEWQTWSPTLLLGSDIHGATLGIVGPGRIGMAMARRAVGFNMRLLYHARTRRPNAEAELGLSYRALPELLAESDFVSLHVPLTSETRGLIGDDKFDLMKPSAILVNTARGPIVNEDALCSALRDGRLAGAALDVFEEEPLAPGHPLTQFANVVLAPHLGSASTATRSKMADMAIDNCLAVLEGRRPPNCLNPEVLALEAGGR